MVIFLGNCVLCSKPQILFCIQRITKACPCETGNGFVCVVHSLDHTRTVEVMNQLFGHSSVFCGKYKLSFSFTRYADLRIFIHITISVTSQCNWLFPVFHTWFNALYLNRCTEHSSIQSRTDRSVRRFPHFFQIILCHAGCVWCNRSTFYCYAIFLCSLCGIKCYLIVGLITILKPQIIILCLQINVWQQQFVLNHLPQNSGHLISIHLYERCFHLDFCHVPMPPEYFIKIMP